jgi:hypothetical protein
MGTVWTFAAKSPGESLWNLVKNQRFLVEKTVLFSSRHSASLVHGIEATTTTSPAHQKIATYFKAVIRAYAADVKH